MTNNNNAPIEEQDLLAYVDDALSPARRAEVEAHLQESPEDAARVAADLAIADDLRAAFDKLTEEGPMPVVAPTRRVGRPFALAASLLLAALVGAAAGWGLKRDVGAPAQPPFLAEAFAAHQTYVVEVAHPVEVEAENRGHLATWLSNRLGRPFEVPDLRVAGLELVGGRLLPSPSAPAAQLMYEDAAGHRVTVYLRRGGQGETTFRFAETGAERAFYWSDENFGYALTGPLTRERLLDIAHLLQVQVATPVGGN